MTGTRPLRYVWWLVSDASGIVALLLVSVSVLLGLAMAAKAISSPRRRRAAARLHEHVALASLASIAVHGLALLGDEWLKPGWRGIVVPFALSYRPAFTGIGIVAGYLAMLVGPTFYLRRRIGVRRWRALHRATVIVWILSVGHALGAGSDASSVVAARGGARAGRSDRLPARRSGVRRARPRWRACRATGAERAPAPRSAGDRLRGHRRSAVAGQFDAKRGAPAGRGLGVDLPSVGLNYRPGDRQPEPCASAVS